MEELNNMGSESVTVTKEENEEVDDPRHFFIEMINKYNKES